MTFASLEVPPVDHFFSKDRGISPSGLVFEVGDSNHPKFDLHDLNSRRLDLQNSQSLLLGSDSLDSTLDPTRPPSPEGRSTWVTSPPPNCHYKNCWPFCSVGRSKVVEVSFEQYAAKGLNRVEARGGIFERSSVENGQKTPIYLLPHPKKKKAHIQWNIGRCKTYISVWFLFG